MRHSPTDLIMAELHLVSSIPPSVNHYLSYRVVKRNGKYTAMSYKTKEASDYRKSFSQYVSEEVKNQSWEMTPNKTQHFYVDAVAFFPSIDMDMSNYWKVMLDAITDTQLIWLDDNVVCERVRRIYYDTKDPRIELTVKPVDYIGIFDDVSQLDLFESRCFGCARYNRNCSILRKAKEGRIQQEIHNLECLKYKEMNKRRIK